MRAIIGEAKAVEFYSRLVEDTPHEWHRELAGRAYEGEQKHLQVFTQLFIGLTRGRIVCFKNWGVLSGYLNVYLYYGNSGHLFLCDS